MAALSPSELMALLGPNAPLIEESGHSVQRDSSQWTQFAEAFSVEMAARLRPLVKAATRMQPIGCRLLTAEATIPQIDRKSVVRFWQSSGSAEPVAIVLSPQIVATFVDRMLGGRLASSVEDPAELRPLTEIDHRLVARLIEAVRICFIERTQALSQTPFELNEFDAQAMSLEDAWMPDCSLVQMSFELRFVQGGGTIDLLIPEEVAERIADAPISENLPSDCDQTSLTESMVHASSEASLVAQLVSMRLPKPEIESLSVGDVLLTDLEHGKPVPLLINGKMSGHGTPGTVGLRKGVRLLSHIGMEPLRH